MSSVEIRIKGIKNVKGLKGIKRGKAQRKKRALMEKKRKAEYIVSQNRPYQYVSPILPTYIDRPQLPAPVLQPQIETSPYKALFDNMLLKMKGEQQQEIKKPTDEVPMFSKDYEEKVDKKMNDGDGIKVEEIFTEEDIMKKEDEVLRMKREREAKINKQQELRRKKLKEWTEQKSSEEGFDKYWKENKDELFREKGILTPLRPKGPTKSNKRKISKIEDIED